MTATALVVPATTRHVATGLAILRIVVGVVFAAHGAQKVFTYGLTGTAGAFGQMGIPMAQIAGPAVAIFELVGGILLIAGVLTRIIAALFAIEMVVAILVVHLAAGFFLPNGYEFALLLCAACVALAVGGAGTWSVDDALARRRGSAP